MHSNLFRNPTFLAFFPVVLVGLLCQSAFAEKIGEVTTVWKAIGANHTIGVEVFDDPDIPNVSCWVSRAKTGGVKGSLGVAEDPSNGSIACRQTGPIAISAATSQKLAKETKNGGANVFKKRTSITFKTMQVTRMFDQKRNTLVYLVWSDKLVNGSPKNSLSVVVIAPWPVK
ncbi:MAG: CreA family protein [Deltaproteobacteria bacterium]|nr:CreA family protein [Deltaproteobacteria bacterium]